LSTSRPVSLVELAQTPRLRLVPRWGDSFGLEAAEFAAAFGLVADGWQRLVLDDWLARKGARWLCLTAGLSVPRQNGKNAIIEIRELFGMVLLGEKFLHTAHEVKTARKAFKRLKFFFGEQVNDPGCKFPELNALVTELRSTNGQEAIFLSNGGSVEFVARSKGSGRGFTVDVLVCDEAQHLGEDELEALLPTTSAAPLGNPQWIFAGTPPGPRVAGEVFRRIRREALAKVKRECWHEWSVSGPNADMADAKELHAANPALGIRLQMAVVNGERRNLSPEGYLRERGGWWDEGHTVDAVISTKAWVSCSAEALTITGKPTIALDVSPMLTFAGIVAAGDVGDGRTGVEVTSDGSTLIDFREGTEWAVELLTGHSAEVWIAAGSAAETLRKRLEDGGCTVHTMGRPEYAKACVNFAASVATKRIAHRGQTELDNAVTVGAKRVAGDEGLWTWGRVRSSADITLLVAATVAVAASQAEADYDVLDSIL
jgi:hypothetical protein